MLNGIKYSRRGGTVTTTAHAEVDHIVVEVHDECGGLPPGQAEELFQPFARGDNAAANNKPGLGRGAGRGEGATIRAGRGPGWRRRRSSRG